MAVSIQVLSSFFWLLVSNHVVLGEVVGQIFCGDAFEGVEPVFEAAVIGVVVLQVPDAVAHAALLVDIEDFVANVVVAGDEDGDNGVDIAPVLFAAAIGVRNLDDRDVQMAGEQFAGQAA